MTWKQQENIAYDTKIRYSWWITVAGQAFWYQVSRLSNTFFRPIFRLEFLKNSGVTCFFRAGILEEFSRQNTYELLLSANGYIFDGNSDQLEFMKNSRVICFFSQGNRAYGTKIRYLWWITVADKYGFWRQVARYIFSDIESVFPTGILIGILEKF